ncbi:hypothetical protein B9T27_12965 [Acinetobacter sp. ANC 4648]|nr:hypothetical protein B9T27_12965 [Acinetobacter sp. ANC 4648]
MIIQISLEKMERDFAKKIFIFFHKIVLIKQYSLTLFQQLLFQANQKLSMCNDAFKPAQRMKKVVL